MKKLALIIFLFSLSFFIASKSHAATIFFDNTNQTATNSITDSGEPDESIVGFVWKPTINGVFNSVTLKLIGNSPTPNFNTYLEVFEVTGQNDFPTYSQIIATSTNSVLEDNSSTRTVTFTFAPSVPFTTTKYYIFRKSIAPSTSYSGSGSSLSAMTTPTCTDATTPCGNRYSISGGTVGTFTRTMWGRIALDTNSSRTQITAITSPTTQQQTNDVTFSINLFNANPTVTEFCVRPTNNFQSILETCVPITASGSTSASQTIHLSTNGNYSATLSIKTANDVIVEIRTVNFYVNTQSISFITPTSTESELTNDIFTALDAWTCNISYLSWDPCQQFASFVHDFLQIIWDALTKIIFGWINKPPFSYIQESFQGITLIINNVQSITDAKVPELNINYNINNVTSSITYFSQNSFYSIINQSAWNTIREYCRYILYILFFIALWQRIKSLSFKLNR